MTPGTFAGRPGIRFAYRFVRQGEDVRRTSDAAGAVIEGRLYLFSFEAPANHYFARNVADYRAVVATAKVAPVAPVAPAANVAGAGD